MVTADLPMDTVLCPAADADGERALVRACAAGSGGAFEEIIRRHQPRVARLVRRLLGWPEDVEDVVQEVFMTVLSRSGRFRGQSTLSTWITSIAINRCRSLRRRMGVRWRAIKQLRRLRPVTAGGADASAMAEERRQRVRAAIGSLSAADREIIVLHHLEEMSVDAVAQTLGIRRNAVEVRLHRARRRLGEMLRETML